MIAYATIVLALASFVVGAQPCRGQEFSLEMSIQDQSGLVGSYLPLKLLSSDPPGVFFIVGETQSGCPSTPVYLNDTTATRTTPDDGTEGGTVISPTGALAFDLIDQSIEPTSAERGVYGIQMPYVGDEGLGGWIVVQALRGYQDFGFIVNAVTGAVYYNITGPANQHFFGQSSLSISQRELLILVCSL